MVIDEMGIDEVGRYLSAEKVKTLRSAKMHD